MSHTPFFPDRLETAALIKLRNIFIEDPIAYSRELNIIAEALDGAAPLYPCDELKIVHKRPTINETIPV